MRISLFPTVPLATWLLMGVVVSPVDARTIGNHEAVYDADGTLLPWTTWDDALGREMNWYLETPVEHGYPRFVFATFMDGEYELVGGFTDFIPAMQDGMGIISYLKFYAYDKQRDPRVLQFARYLGDYLVRESLTPDVGAYPRFTRSTGVAEGFPQAPDSGTMADMPYEIEPDKGGIAGYALYLLFEATGEQSYLQQALHNAEVLVANMRQGNDSQSPWPFRVDYRTGEARGEVSGNMTYILRLFDKLIEYGYLNFGEARSQLWSWIKNYQIPSATLDGSLWVQFFEDYDDPNNRTAWAPLNLARYLIEEKESLDPDWSADAGALIQFTERFTSTMDGILVCGEQDRDIQPWGGVHSTFGAVLAMYSAATGSDQYRRVAYEALNYSLYAIADRGCARDASFEGEGCGIWQEDAHTDVIHNFMDAIAAFPGWAQ
jgi:hypothetical protein